MAAFDWDTVADFFTSEFYESGTYSGTDYNMVRYPKTSEEMIADAGAKNAVNFKILSKSSDFTPAKDGDITFPKSGTTYRIKEIQLDSTGKTNLLTLITKRASSV